MISFRFLFGASPWLALAIKHWLNYRFAWRDHN
jgi:hypothetical protein